MVTFSTYVSLAYDVVDEKGLSVDDPAEFMGDLADVYNANNHREASRSAAKSFLRNAVN